MKAARASQKPSLTRSLSTSAKCKVSPWFPWEQQALHSSLDQFLSDFSISKSVPVKALHMSRKTMLVFKVCAEQVKS